MFAGALTQAAEVGRWIAAQAHVWGLWEAWWGLAGGSVDLGGPADFDPRPPVVRMDEPIPPEAGAGALQPIALALLILSIYAVWRQRRRAKKLGLTGMRSFAVGAAVGNVLMDINALLMPDRPDAAVMASLEEEVVADAFGDGRRPADRESDGPAQATGPDLANSASPPAPADGVSASHSKT